ncbi:MAG: sn-glycerol-3-phosphate ABC transporter ATP-binding protein UgpC [Alphaproteobacteria bacterium]|nr:sn-glycerol-3-phosphate ABC transporter ATP-binding protein UgpC [Alphaproteobacteria bacterium]
MADTGSASVQLDGVHKRYGDVHVVKGIDLDIAPGEFVVLVGPSGCGKSTTLRMIAGLEDISEGELRIGGRRVNETPPKDRDIGMVFQSYALYPHMTVADNIGFALKLRRTPPADIEARVREVAAILGLGDLLQRRPGQLSGGQRQRVAMGRAIARRPSVFLFDEPLSNLDAALRVQMRAELAALHRDLGTTMVYVTHDQVEAMTLATRIAVLHQGVLQQVGPPMTLFQRPANRFVAGFIGSPSMNFVDGVLASDGTGPAFSGPSGLVVSMTHVDAGAMPAGAKLTLGVRPHDLVVGDAGPLRGVVRTVERMGWEAFVHVDVAGTTLVARVEGPLAARVDLGDSLALAVPDGVASLFGADGVALGRRRS